MGGLLINPVLACGAVRNARYSISNACLVPMLRLSATIGVERNNQY